MKNSFFQSCFPLKEKLYQATERWLFFDGSSFSLTPKVASQAKDAQCYSSCPMAWKICDGLMSLRQRVWPSGHTLSKQGAQLSGGW